VEESHRQSITQQARRPSEKMDIEPEVPLVKRNIHTNQSIRLCSEAVVANYND